MRFDRDPEVSAGTKGARLGETIRLGELATRGWNVKGGDVSLPAVTLELAAVENNLRVMAAYVNRHEALLAPHAKTTMSPELIERQLEAGAWGVTVATPYQLARVAAWEVPHVLLANQVVEPAAVEHLRVLLDTTDVDVIVLVDDAVNVSMLQERLSGARRPLGVMVEVGEPGGRCGVRTETGGVELASAVNAAPDLLLRGVSAYEAVLARGRTDDDLARVDDLLEVVRAVTVSCCREELLGHEPFLVSVGGSIYFDRVVEQLCGDRRPHPQAQVLLRSGCYIAHDSDRYRDLSPLDGHAAPDDKRLRDALRAWAVVLSIPDPSLAILGVGKRDVPYDVRLPHVVGLFRQGRRVPLAGAAEITRLMDQHAFATMTGARCGDVVELSLSHPCGAFDRSPLIPLITADGDIVGAATTHF